MGILLIKDIAKRSSDVDGLSKADHHELFSRHWKRLGRKKTRNILGVFKDLVITHEERYWLKYKLDPSSFRSINSIIGTDGKKLFRKHWLGRLKSKQRVKDKATYSKTQQAQLRAIYLRALAYLKGYSLVDRIGDDKIISTLVSNHLLAEYDIYDPRPLAVVIYPKSDWNNAFGAPQHELEPMIKGYYVRYYEAETEDDFVAALKDATKRRKASLLIIGGHGSQKYLAFGAPDPAKGVRAHEKYYLDTGDENDLKGLTNRIADGGHIVLDSCYNAYGGRYASNNISFLSRMFPQAFVHAQMGSSALEPQFGNDGRFIGIRNAKWYIKMAVIRKKTGYYFEYKNDGFKKLPHPQHTSRTTTKTWRKKLAEISQTHPDVDVRNAAKYLLGKENEIDWSGKGVLSLAVTLMKKSEFSSLHYHIVQAIKNIDNPAMTEALIYVLSKSKNEDARRDSLYALSGRKDPRVIPSIIATLYHDDLEIRWRAADILGEIKAKEAVPDLCRVLRYRWPGLRSSAAEALGEIKDARAVPSLCAALSDDDPYVTKEAAKALGKIGSARAVPALIAALKNKNGEVRQKVAWALGKTKDARAVPALIAALKDKEYNVRWAAAKALGEIKDARAVLALSVALKDEHDWVKYEAAVALGEIKDARAVPALIAALKFTDVYYDFLKEVAKALGKIKDPSAAPALIAVLEDNEEYYKVRWEATKALGNIEDARAVAPLIAVLKDNERGDTSKLEAVKALGKIKNARAVPVIIALLKDTDEEFRREAARALGKINHNSATPYLTAALKDTDEEVRREAAKALGTLKDERALPALITSLDDPNYHVKETAAMALRNFDHPRAKGALHLHGYL